MNVNTEGLPPEMQQRIAEIIEKAKANAVPQTAPSPQSQRPEAPAPIAKPPSLMDHVVQLRQEVAAMRQEMANMSQQVAAAAQVTEAVGGAVGQLYGMFFEQSQAPTYSSSFEAQQPNEVDDY